MSEATSNGPLSPELLAKMNAYWRAANYLSVGQIYLKDNPLLECPLTLDDVKPRLLGHWGTTPGLNFLYVHWNRLIRERDLNMMYVIGPGHGGPALVANTYLEGSYSEIYPHIEQNKDGIKRLFRQFSWPYGIPSHVAPETPGSIHEGGELGYSLVHAYGAAFDNPDLVVACVVGDGEAETGPLATSWHSNKFLNPATDGAVLPILHLNGYKIANPTPRGAGRFARAGGPPAPRLFRSGRLAGARRGGAAAGPVARPDATEGQNVSATSADRYSRLYGGFSQSRSDLSQCFLQLRWPAFRCRPVSARLHAQHSLQPPRHRACVL